MERLDVATKPTDTDNRTTARMRSLTEMYTPWLLGLGGVKETHESGSQVPTPMSEVW